MRTAAVIFGLCLVAPALQAQEVNDRCLLQEPTKLFMGKDGERLMTELEAKTIVILKVSHSLRWRVATERGRLGFIDKLWLNKFCTLSKSEAAPSPSPRPKTPSTNATHEIAMVAANLELSAAKAMRSSSSSSTSKVESDTKASSSAGAAREIQCIESRQSALIRVAVYDFKLGNLSKSLGRLMTNSVLDEIRKLEGVSAIGMDEIREMLSFEAQRQTLGCEADEACLAEIGGALGVDELIFGSISDAEHGRTLSIRRIDQMRAEVLQTLNQRLETGDGEEFLLAVGPGIKKLYPGIVNRPGTTRGVEKKILLRVSPPPISRFWTLSAMGAAVATLAFGGTLAYLGREDARNYSTGAGYLPGRVNSADFQGLRSSGEQRLAIGNGALWTGATLALSSIVMSFFTDWHDYGKEEVD